MPTFVTEAMHKSQCRLSDRAFQSIGFFLKHFIKMGCLSECNPELEALVLGDNCAHARMDGGLYKVGFMGCDTDFDDVTGGSITELASWTSLLTSNPPRLIMSSPILGSKAEDSFTRQRFNSCQPEEVSGAIKTFNFEDFNHVPVTAAQIAWWRQIQEKYGVLKVLFVTCDDFVYGPYDNGTWSINVSEIRDTTKESKTKWAGSIQVADNGLLTVPYYVPGLVGLI